MQVRVSDETLLADLIDYLRARFDIVVTQTGPKALEANILGYGMEGASMELDLRLRAWQSAHPGVLVEQVREYRHLAAADPPVDDDDE